MTARTVTVHLKAKVGDYLAGIKMSEKAAKDLRQETDRLNKAGDKMTRGGIISALAGVPGVASAAASGIGLVPAAALSGAAALGTLMVATNGVGDAMKAVGENDAAKLNEELADLSQNAQLFVREYQRVRPALQAAGDATQNALFSPLIGNLDLVTRTYLPLLMRQAPQVSAELGKGGAAFATWSTAPRTVAQVNGQFDLAVDVVAELNRFLLAGLGLMLDLADAGADFTRGTVSGLADGAEALERWVGNARAAGQLNQIFENGSRILDRLGEVAGQAGELLADIVDNPALVDGAEQLFDVMGIGLDIVHALLMAFESLPSGMQSTIVTVAVLGGAIVAVTGRVLTLKAALDNMKLSAAQAGTAAKGVGGVLAGPWGIALTVGATLLGVFAARQAEAKAAADALRGTLDRQTGAFTEASREQVVNQLIANGSIRMAKELGLNVNDLTNAIMNGSAATQEFYDKQIALQGGPMKANGPWGDFREGIQEAADAVDTAKGNHTDFQAAVGETGNKVATTTGKIRGQISALQELAAELRAANDPAFALIKAQRDMSDAQEDYNAAVKEHGRNSQQAKDASLKLAELSLVLTDAIAGAGEAFDGKLSPAMRNTLVAAGLTEQQIKDIEAAFVTAKKKGDEFAKTYEAEVKADTAQAEAAVRALTLKVLALKNKNIKISASVYWNDKGLHVGTGTQTQHRWGGVDYHASAGGSIQAHYASAPTVLYGERATGGEAFIPRNGNFGRSMGILSTAASWYGMQVGRPGAGGGGGGGGPVAVELTLVMKMQNGREMRQTLRADAVGRGVPRAQIQVAYP